jgi:hypothetical protein
MNKLDLISIIEYDFLMTFIDFFTINNFYVAVFKKNNNSKLK